MRIVLVRLGIIDRGVSAIGIGNRVGLVQASAMDHFLIYAFIEQVLIH